MSIRIIGNGGHAKVIREICKTNKLNIIGFYDDMLSFENNYLGKILLIDKNDKSSIICAIGSNEIRKQIYEKFIDCNWYTLIHPFTFISSDIRIGSGTMICAGAIIQPKVIIGKQCIINTKVSIDHECIIDDFVHIAPGSTLCGNVIIGESTFIGAGTTIKNGIKIGSNAIIGCGSNVVKDIPNNVIAYGNPCKIIKQK